MEVKTYPDTGHVKTEDSADELNDLFDGDGMLKEAGER